jgi:glycyl-tRNA synthetase
MEASKTSLEYYDEESKGKVIPYVASEPSQGIDRAFLAFMFEAYNDDKDRGNVVLKLDSRLAPVKVGVFPLVNKLNDKAKEIFGLLNDEFNCAYDKSGSVGRRYARADEMGVPYCVTIDFDTLEKGDCTIRDRDSTKQIRVKVEDIVKVLSGLLKNKLKFNEI